MKEDKEDHHCSRKSCIYHLFFTSASQNPNSVAVIHASSSSSSSSSSSTGDSFFTYSCLLSAVDSLSCRLRTLLLEAPQPRPITAASNSMRTPRILGIYMPPSVQYIVAVLSVLRNGEAFLPLDPSWPKQRVLSVMASSNVHLVIACASPFGMNPKSPTWLVDCSACPVLWFSMEQGDDDDDDDGVAGDFANLDWPCESGNQRLFCYLMYTSGSTGKPKGVCGTEQGLLNRFWWMQELYPLSGEERLLFKTSISFIDHLQEFLSAIVTGSTLVVPPFNVLKQKMLAVVDFIQAYSINRLTAVPSLMRAVLPTLKGRYEMRIPNSLKLLVLSGETLSLSLWEMLSKILPGTNILNLYGSTEVSGDCTYFDCKRLPKILESEPLTSVPIGIPIANCDVVLVGEDDLPDHGEIYVAGLCNSVGYYNDSTFISLDYVNLSQDNTSCSSDIKHGSQLLFRTGDYATRLQGGDLVFLGRKDRTIKRNGQRIALEEIEDTLRGHPDVVDASVISKRQGETILLVAFIILKEGRSNEGFRSNIKSWMVDKLPLAMIPNQFTFTESFPLSSTGKVNYELLASSTFLVKHVQDKIAEVGNTHLSHDLGVDMRMLYCFPSPSKLYGTLLERKDLDVLNDAKWEMNLEKGKRNMFHAVDTPNPAKVESEGRLLRALRGENKNHDIISKHLKLDSRVSLILEGLRSTNGFSWNSNSIPMSCSFSRCNKVMYEGEYRVNDAHLATCAEVPRSRTVLMEELWKVYMGSCVDASPLIVFKGLDIFLFIGSHSHEFMCVDARRIWFSGSVQWKIKLEGRVECSAAIVGDFSQVVVGCYKGKIYFLDSSNGNILWSFQASSEVKSQPLVDISRQLIWCGSHDHNLYALDYKNRCCVYNVPCGGSIYGSPVIDELNNILYVASTSGRMTAISIKALPFNILWMHELEAPVFGSLAINSSTGSVVCCLVDGHVIVFDSSGSIVWKYKISGNIFAGACISSALPSQVVICSRNGNVYSFEVETGNKVWKYDVGDPIIASAYVDDHLYLSSQRLLCVCSGSGSIRLLGVGVELNNNDNVVELARIDLQGDIFSSPVMIGGRIFVGCRDDHVHCIHVKL
nr:putative acyl-activating enzyme 19 isoform X4 [Ziziphus jujuba var. spinosa]